MNFGLYRGCIEAGQYFFDLISPKNCFNKYWAWFLSHEIIWVPKINNFPNLKILLHHPVVEEVNIKNWNTLQKVYGDDAKGDERMLNDMRSETGENTDRFSGKFADAEIHIRMHFF